MYEIFFISYNEPNADKNWEILKSRFPTARRIHGVKGIQQAHYAAAKQSFTKMFYVVDGDAEILTSFDFSHSLEKEDYETVHVWKSRNPINGLEYGYGGVKLLPKHKVIQMSMDTVDMTTSMSNRFKVVNVVSNITAFNTDSFSAWRSGFRECVKLSSKVIDRNYEQETEDRLIVWCSEGDDKPFGKYAIAGARAGRKYGTDNISNKDALVLINDFEWLEEKFKLWQQEHGEL